MSRRRSRNLQPRCSWVLLCWPRWDATACGGANRAVRALPSPTRTGWAFALPGGTPLGQRGVARGQLRVAVFAAVEADGRLGPQRLRGGALCPTPAPRRICGLDFRTEGPLEHVLRLAHDLELRQPRGQGRGARGGQK